MKDIYEVLRQKEAEYERLTKEVQALRIVAPLLEDELQIEAQPIPTPVGTTHIAVRAKQVAARDKLSEVPAV